MMKKQQHCVIWIALLLAASGKLAAQDIHFSQFFEAPLLRNPSLAGIYTGDIRVQAKEQSTHWEIAVIDNGIGFDSQHAERIFSMFQRLHHRQAYPGNGIGLAIAKRIIGRHGGKIWASGAPGQGAVFTFTLPKHPA